MGLLVLLRSLRVHAPSTLAVGVALGMMNSEPAQFDKALDLLLLIELLHHLVVRHLCYSTRIPILLVDEVYYLVM